MIETPLGALLGGVRLRDLGRADRLDELSFELPLVGGDEPTGTLTLSALAHGAARAHAAGRRAGGLPARCSRTRRCASDVRGYLTGSIDLVARVAGADGVPRFAVLDYKTNWLAAPGRAR